MSVTIPISEFKTSYVRSKRHLIDNFNQLAKAIAPIVRDKDLLREVRSALETSLKTRDFAPYVEGLRTLRSVVYGKLQSDPVFLEQMEKLKKAKSIAKAIDEAQADAVQIGLSLEAKRVSREETPWRPVVDDATGEMYWWNVETDETTFDDPRTQPSMFHALPETYSQPWRQVYDETSGAPYWHNVLTHETQWEPPEEMADDLSVEDL